MRFSFYLSFYFWTILIENDLFQMWIMSKLRSFRYKRIYGLKIFFIDDVENSIFIEMTSFLERII